MTRVLICLCLLALPAASQAQEQPTPEQAAMLARMQPGPEHKELAALVGQWSQEITYSTGQQKLKTLGKANNRLILGGRFLASERTSENPAGARFGDATMEALTIYGFDRRTGEYTVLELDSMGTYWVSAAGTMKPAKTIVMAGESLDDHGGQREIRRFEMVLKLIDADTYLTQIIFKFPGKPDLTLVETVSRRIK